MTSIARASWMEGWEAEEGDSAASRRSAARDDARVHASSRSMRYYGREATARIPQPRPELERTRALPRPKLVRQQRHMWPTIVAVMVFAALFLGAAIICPIMLSSRAADVETQVGQTERTEAQLSSSIAALSSQVSALSAPDRVAEQAAQLGLQPVDKVQYVQTGTGDAEGDATVASR